MKSSNQQFQKQSQKDHNSNLNPNNYQHSLSSSSLKFKECTVCFIKEAPQSIFVLQCNHFICHQCLKRQVKIKMLLNNTSAQFRQSPSQKILLKCQVRGCNGITMLQEQQINSFRHSNIYNGIGQQSLMNSGSGYNSRVQNSRALSIKAYRDLSATQIKNKTIFCITCNQLLGLQQFLQSSHRSHQVQPLDKCFPQMQKNLAQTSENLSNMRQSLYSNEVFYTHQKKKLNDEYNNNLMKIKIMFDNLKESIFLKQKLATEQYQGYMIEIFSQIDRKMKNVSQTIEQCQKYEEWIQSNLQITSLTSQSKQIIRCANFYVDNFFNINQFLNVCQTQKNSKSRLYNNPSSQCQLQMKVSITNQNIKKIIQEIKNCQIVLTRQMKQAKFQTLKQQDAKNKIDSNYFSKKKKQIIIDPLTNSNSKNEQSFVSTFSSNGLSKVKSITNFTNFLNKTGKQQPMSISDKINELRKTLRKQTSQKSFYTKSIIFQN